MTKMFLPIFWGKGCRKAGMGWGRGYIKLSGLGIWKKSVKFNAFVLKLCYVYFFRLGYGTLPKQDVIILS
jgi:hypothetical protein